MYIGAQRQHRQRRARPRPAKAPGPALGERPADLGRQRAPGQQAGGPGARELQRLAALRGARLLRLVLGPAARAAGGRRRRGLPAGERRRHRAPLQPRVHAPHAAHREDAAGAHGPAAAAAAAPGGHPAGLSQERRRGRRARGQPQRAAGGGPGGPAGGARKGTSTIMTNFTQSVKNHDFCSGPISVDPICQQPRRSWPRVASTGRRSSSAAPRPPPPRSGARLAGRA